MSQAATALARKAAVEAELASLEKQLFAFEDALLVDSNGSNIARGWEGFARAGQLKRGSVAVTVGDRLFAGASITAPSPVDRTVPFPRPITTFALPTPPPATGSGAADGGGRKGAAAAGGGGGGGGEARRK